MSRWRLWCLVLLTTTPALVEASVLHAVGFGSAIGLAPQASAPAPSVPSPYSTVR